MQTKPEHTAATPQLGRYEIDTGSSTVRFRTRHLFGLGPVRGSFAIRSGTVDIAEPVSRRIRAEIDAASFRTGNPARDTAVRSARFLDAGTHPVMTFASERTDGSTLTGMLTVRGVNRPVTLSIEQSAVAAGSFTARAGRASTARSSGSPHSAVWPGAIST